MRCGSIGGPACVTPPAAWWAEISEAGHDVDDHRPRRSQPRHRIRPVCSAAFMGGDATIGARAAEIGPPVTTAATQRWTVCPRERAAATRTLEPVGLYDPAYEHDGCGVACLARLDGQPAHETISRAIETLDNLEHRGAEGADAETGDGAGILIQIPDAFLRAELDFALPRRGRYAVAVCMLPREADRRSAARP